MTQDFEKLFREAKDREEEARKDREALERVQRMMRLNAVPKPTASPALAFGLPLVDAKPSRESDSEVSLSDAVREAIEGLNLLDDNFSSTDIRRYIEEKYPRLNAAERTGTLSSILSGFLKKGEIVKVSGYKGVISHYRKKEKAP